MKQKCSNSLVGRVYAEFTSTVQLSLNFFLNRCVHLKELRQRLNLKWSADDLTVSQGNPCSKAEHWTYWPILKTLNPLLTNQHNENKLGYCYFPPYRINSTWLHGILWDIIWDGGIYHGLTYMCDICHSVFNEKVTRRHQTTFNYCSIHWHLG